VVLPMQKRPHGDTASLPHHHVNVGDAPLRRQVNEQVAPATVDGYPVVPDPRYVGAVAMDTSVRDILVAEPGQSP
jgi:hypothetical protein